MAPGADQESPPVTVRCLRLASARLRESARFDRDARSRGARALLRAMLERTTGIAGALWHLEPGPNGKLFAFDPQRRAGPEVSLSHSLHWVAAGVSRIGRIGVDLEVVRPNRAIEQIAELAFGPNERAMVARDGEAAFYRIWTLREAMAKASGAGLTEVTDRRDRVGAQNLGDGPWRGSAAGTDWLLFHRAPAEAVHLAAAVALSGETETSLIGAPYRHENENKNKNENEYKGRTHDEPAIEFGVSEDDSEVCFTATGGRSAMC